MCPQHGAAFFGMCKRVGRKLTARISPSVATENSERMRRGFAASNKAGMILGA